MSFNLSAASIGRKELASYAAKVGQVDLYRTGCNRAVLDAFGISKETYKYAQTITDVVRLLRKQGISVRSRKSAAGKAVASVGRLRAIIASGKLGVGFFAVRVPGHVILLDTEGYTVVDTNPRKRDRRKVTHVYLIDSAIVQE